MVTYSPNLLCKDHKDFDEEDFHIFKISWILNMVSRSNLKPQV